MEITAIQHGEIYCLEPDSRLVQIQSVTPQYFTYITETGERFASSGRSIRGKVLTDAARREQFLRSSAVGAVLAAAETKARAILARGTESREELDAASRISKFTEAQRRHLNERVSERGVPAAEHPRSSLTALIGRANAKKQESAGQGTSKKGPNREDR